MKRTVSSIFLTLIFLPILSQLNSFAEDITRWRLPEGAKARLGKGNIRQVAYSPNGMHVAAAGSAGIWIYDVTIHQEVALLTGNMGPVSSVAFSPDGNTIVSASKDRTIRLWNVNTRKHLKTLIGHTDSVSRVVSARTERQSPVRVTTEPSAYGMPTLANSSKPSQDIKMWSQAWHSVPTEILSLVETGMMARGISTAGLGAEKSAFGMLTRVNFSKRLQDIRVVSQVWYSVRMEKRSPVGGQTARYSYGTSPHHRNLCLSQQILRLTVQ